MNLKIHAFFKVPKVREHGLASVPMGAPGIYL
jgi:hypothetical protein